MNSAIDFQLPNSSGDISLVWKQTGMDLMLTNTIVQMHLPHKKHNMDEKLYYYKRIGGRSLPE